nr:DUF2071 domain-containing protein [Microbacterium sp. MF43]
MPAGAPLEGRPIASQGWRDAAFLHWRVSPRQVEHLYPTGVVPDLLDGETWIGLIAFRLEDARVGRSPSLRRWGTFTEVNVRLYGVDARGRRGVVFRSLEAASLPAVIGARALFSLPYYWADMTESHRVGARHSTHEYTSRRRFGDARLDLRVTVDRLRPVDTPTSRFLTARWALFQERGRRVMRLPNTHEAWTLFPAEVTHFESNLLERAGVSGLSAVPDSVLYSPGVRAWFGSGERLPLP